MDRVDGGDDGVDRDEGRRYFPLIFLLVTSYFSLSFDVSPLSFLLLFFLTFQKNRIKIWSFRILKRVCSKCEVFYEGINTSEGDMVDV